MPRNYVDDSIGSLMGCAGLRLIREETAAVTLFDSGSTALQYLDPVRARWPRVNIRPAARRLNLLENFRRALAEASADAEYVCLMEDDVGFRPLAMLSLLRWLERIGNRDFACATLWPLPGRTVDGEIVAAPGVFWGNYFVVFRSAKAREMLEHPLCREWMNPAAADLMIGTWARETGQDILVNGEGLVQHQGLYSSLGDRDERSCSEFVGGFPAVSLEDAQYCLGRWGADAASDDRETMFSRLFPGVRVKPTASWRLARDGDRVIVIRAARRYAELNAVAVAILAACDGGAEFGEIVSRVEASFEGQVSRSECGAAVSDTLLHFLDGQLISIA